MTPREDSTPDLMPRHPPPGHFYWRRAALYQIAVTATRPRRCEWLIIAIQVFDLTHVSDAIIPHNVG